MTMPRSTVTSPPSSETPTDKPINPLLAEAWPPGSKRVYRIGVFFWILILQPLAILADFLRPSYWLLWHLLALMAALVIGHMMTMRILTIAIQEWKNRV
jgi:hypothetical protein